MDAAMRAAETVSVGTGVFGNAAATANCVTARAGVVATSTFVTSEEAERPNPGQSHREGSAMLGLSAAAPQHAPPQPPEALPSRWGGCGRRGAALRGVAVLSPKLRRGRSSTAPPAAAVDPKRQQQGGTQLTAEAAKRPGERQQEWQRHQNVDAPAEPDLLAEQLPLQAAVERAEVRHIPVLRKLQTEVHPMVCEGHDGFGTRNKACFSAPHLKCSSPMCTTGAAAGA